MSSAVDPHESAPVQTSARGACDAVAAFSRRCGQLEPSVSALELTEQEAARLRRHVLKIDNWLDRFANSLPPAAI